MKSKKRNDLSSLADEELIAIYKKSNESWVIGELFERYTHLVFGVCMKYLKDEENSKDAVMQIFGELHQKLQAHEVSSFKSWIYSVAKNHCLMEIRKGKTIERVKSEIYEKIHHEIMESANVFHHYNSADLLEKIPKLQHGITLLKTEQRKCIELLYLQNKSYREVAEITGYTLKNVKSHIQNGKRNLRNFLENG
ncbi:MAG: sigma-70 family RNA polymerase sigma factor [Bacteroidales bacterium]|nr:sigma-70 family RNA polymerase sigma factor [Bacteroidales bacterium]